MEPTTVGPLPLVPGTLGPRPAEPAAGALAPQSIAPATGAPQPAPPATAAPRAGVGAGADAQRDRPAGRTIVFGNLELRLDEMQALVEGTRVGLTVREFQVLAVLADRADRVVRRPEIYRNVWGGEMKHRDRAVDVFVRKVRTKLAATAPGWAYVHTHFGIGYRFAPEPAMSAQDEERAEGAAA
jgi:DNA-binding winged helix-turn-helix (wHTH) protein